MSKHTPLLALFSWLSLFSQGMPNHLEPIRPGMWTIYLQKGVDKLTPKRNVILWMLATPAFKPEYAISLIDTSQDISKPNYILSFSRASRRILAPPPPPPFPGEKVQIASPLPPIKIATSARPIPEHTAKRIIETWSKLVKSTRYAEDSATHSGCDGCSYFFYIQDFYYGKTWSPETPVPSAAVDLADTLVVYATDNSKPKQDLINSLEQACRALNSKLAASR
jgi:hypothetical protein